MVSYDRVLDALGHTDPSYIASDQTCAPFKQRIPIAWGTFGMCFNDSFKEANRPVWDGFYRMGPSTTLNGERTSRHQSAADALKLGICLTKI
jgi:hypothetical protein